MADYSVTASSVRASVYAKRFRPTPEYNFIGEPPAPVPALSFAGAAITAGQAVYQGTDDLFYPADANGADPLYKVVGIAENSASANQPVSIVVEDPQFTPGCAMLAGDSIILSATPGGICPDADKASGWKVSHLMSAWSTTQAELKVVRTDVAKA